MSDDKGEQRHCMVCRCVLKLEGGGEDLWAVAKAGFSILGGSSPWTWPRPGSLLLLGEKRRRKKEFREELVPWRLSEQVAGGPFHVINPQPRVAGTKR